MGDIYHCERWAKEDNFTLRKDIERYSNLLILGWNTALLVSLKKPYLLVPEIQLIEDY